MSPGDLGRDIERLPGVLAATVFPDVPGGPRVYLAVDRDADEHALRATLLAMLADYGLHADASRIHIGTAPTPPPTPPHLPRLTLDALDVHRSHNNVACTIHIRARGQSHAGSATEPDTRDGPARAAARATLDAVQNLDPDLRLGLHGIRRHDLFGSAALTVLVEAALGRTHVQLPGTALIDRSHEHAATMATLHALRSWTA